MDHNIKMCMTSYHGTQYQCARCQGYFCLVCDRPAAPDIVKTVVRYCPDWRCQRERGIELGELSVTSVPKPAAPGNRPMVPIPIQAARRVADAYGYDQVIVVARRVGMDPDPHGEHVTTYGVNAEHCAAAAQCGKALQKFMGWEP